MAILRQLRRCGPCKSLYGSTWKGTLLLSVPLGSVTMISPLLAPTGTCVKMSEAERSVNIAGVPLNVTLVAPVKSSARIPTATPILPEVGRVFTNGPRPTDKL